MKINKLYIAIALGLAVSSCSEKTLDNINIDRNDPSSVLSTNELPSAIVGSAYGTTATDLAWYASLFVEHSAGVDEQFYDADRRNGVTASSFADNSWNATYSNLTTLKDIITRCTTGSEKDNKTTLGIAQVLTAYNLAVITDMWGSAPWSDALNGLDNTQPKYDNQEQIYNAIFQLLNDAIANLAQPSGDIESSSLGDADMLYGGDKDKWTKAAWSLKARYFMRLQNVVPTAVDSALVCVSKGFTAAGEALVFNKYEATDIGSNPWWAMTYYERGDFCSGKTLYDLMASRNDPRMDAYFIPLDDGSIVPAPNGTASRTRAGNGKYSYSNITGNAGDRTSPTPMMSYHELLFIKAEAQARKGVDFKASLKSAIEANFAYHKVSNPDAYYITSVVPLLGSSMTSYLKEILTQKYIATYEAEAMEAYNDYRRTRIVTLHNPANNLANYGFVERMPYASSEVTNNSGNVPSVNIFHDKVWWAGGSK